MVHSKRAVVLVALAAVALGGCQRQAGGPSVSSYEEQRKAGASGGTAERKAKPPREVAGSDAASERSLGAAGKGYVYDPIGKRDPFRSFVLDRVAEEEASEKAPLEQFDLSQLSVRGMVWDADRRRALIRDPSGRGYIVAEGDPVGKNDGRVIRIGDSAVVVREAYVDFHGEKTTKDIEMRVRKSEGG